MIYSQKLSACKSLSNHARRQAQQVARSPPCARSRTYSSLTARPSLARNKLKVVLLEDVACERIDRTLWTARPLSHVRAWFPSDRSGEAHVPGRLGFPRRIRRSSKRSLFGSKTTHTFRYATLAVHACSIPRIMHAAPFVFFIWFDRI
jgi:hypothetical protein